MAKYLVFKNGDSVEFTDESTITNLVTVLNSYSEIDPIIAEFTPANLVGAEFDGTPILNVLPVSMSATSSYNDEAIVVTFVNRYKTDVELLQEQMIEVQEAIAELAEG